MRRGLGLILVSVAIVTAATACTGSGDKAGGGSGDHQPLVLTLESEDVGELTPVPEFAAAVSRLSGGSLRIRLVSAGRSTEVDYERGVVEDVRRGKAQLGIVGVRVWDTVGVPSFRALLAPLLVDSFELQMRVLASRLPHRMLDGVAKAGVVGIAVLPGPLRQPLGLSRAFTGPGDYRGTTIGARPAGLARATLRALGARPRSTVPGDLSGLDGIELDPATIHYNGFDERPGWLTTNVVLWPKPYSVVMNRRAFDELTSSQQELLRRAAREAAAPEQRQLVGDAASAMARACAAAKLTFIEASPDELAALRRAVQPVYDQLEHDPETARALRDIASLRRGGSGGVAAGQRCRGTSARATSASSLEGTWRLSKPTEQELLAAGVDPKNAAALSRLPGTPALVFEGGHHRGIDLETGEVLSTGTYEVEGEVVRLVFETGVAVQFGRVYSLRWSVYRDTLKLTAMPGSEPLIALVLRPWHRVR